MSNTHPSELPPNICGASRAESGVPETKPGFHCPEEQPRPTQRRGEEGGGIGVPPATEGTHLKLWENLQSHINKYEMTEHAVYQTHSF